MVQTITKNTFVWSHLAVIFFHALIAGVLIYFGKSEIDNIKLKKYLFWIGIVLLVISLLALVPIFSDKEYTIK